MTREDAITTLKEMHDSFDRIHENSDGEIGYEQMTALDMAIEALTDRPTGEWIEMGENEDKTHNIKCNQCGQGYKTRGHAHSLNTRKKYKFCPNCSAKMGGDDE